jgi:hypothetical protein
MAFPAITSDLEEMASLLTHVVSLSGRVGSFSDGPHLREQIQADVKRLGILSQQLKGAMARMSGNPELGAYQARFEELRERVRRDLEPVVQKLRGSATPGGGAGDAAAGPVLDQGLIDADTDQIDVLEQQVGAIVTAMREVSGLFTQVMEELQAQRHKITVIEGETSAAVSQMESGNEALKTASKHQKSSRKCLCCIFVIVLLVVAAVAVVLVFTLLPKSSPTPTVSPSPSPPPPPTETPTATPVPPPPTQSEQPPEPTAEALGDAGKWR